MDGGTTGTRIGTDRAAEAIATGARTTATACPSCTIMLTDGVAANGRGTGGADDAPVEVVDVALLLLDAVRGSGDGGTGTGADAGTGGDGPGTRPGGAGDDRTGAPL